jgi:hypothetical protein
MSICARIRTCSEMLSVGSKRKRMFAPSMVLGLQRPGWPVAGAWLPVSVREQIGVGNGLKVVSFMPRLNL